MRYLGFLVLIPFVIGCAVYPFGGEQIEKKNVPKVKTPMRISYEFKMVKEGNNFYPELPSLDQCMTKEQYLGQKDLSDADRKDFSFTEQKISKELEGSHLFSTLYAPKGSEDYHLKICVQKQQNGLFWLVTSIFTLGILPGYVERNERLNVAVYKGNQEVLNANYNQMMDGINHLFFIFSGTCEKFPAPKECQELPNHSVNNFLVGFVDQFARNDIVSEEEFLKSREGDETIDEKLDEDDDNDTEFFKD